MPPTDLLSLRLSILRSRLANPDALRASVIDLLVFCGWEKVTTREFRKKGLIIIVPWLFITYSEPGLGSEEYEQIIRTDKTEIKPHNFHSVQWTISPMETTLNGVYRVEFDDWFTRVVEFLQETERFVG